MEVIKKGSAEKPHTPERQKQRYKNIDTLLEFAIDDLKEKSKSRKMKQYTLSDAISHKHLGSKRTQTIIDVFAFLGKNPLNKNDYYKYFNSYVNGIELSTEYFKHDVNKLKEYYRKFDDNNKFNPFNIDLYRTYVLFMSLKLNGVYNNETDDEIFNVKYDKNREYNPLSSIPSVLRGELPYKVKEYDIKRAFPTFIDIELGSGYRDYVYEFISKKEFAIALNTHHQSKSNKEDAIKTLQKVYGEDASRIITEDRFKNRGKAFEDFTKYEDDFINKFVKSNHLENYARLHDGVFVLEEMELKNLVFDEVEFTIKECIKPEIVNKKVLFYEFDDNGYVELKPTLISDFLIQENFVRITTADDKIQLLKNENNIIDYFNHKTNMVSFLESKIIEFDKTNVKDAIARHNHTTIAQSYPLIKPTELVYYKDKKTSFGIPFKNGFYYFDNLNDIKIKVKEYKEVKGFFAPHPIQQKTFEYTDEIGDFETFIYRASTGKKDYNSDDLEFQSLCSIIGYLGTSYKKPNFNPIIVLTDDGANEDNRNGRRGKSLVTKGIGYFTKTLVKGGNEFDGAYRHNYAELDLSHNVYVIDDAPAGFNYNDLYTQSTGAISVQPKGVKAFEIPFEDTPKFVITTNYIFRLNKNDASSVARFIEMKFKSYYSNEHPPQKEFENLFFDEWDDEQWNRFYSFIYRCVFRYLKNGITKIDYNKDEDNYRAIFDDVKEYVMTSIMDILIKDMTDFNVSEFLEQYDRFGHTYTKEKLFHRNNTKNHIDIFIDANEKYQNYKYCKTNKKWKYQSLI